MRAARVSHFACFGTLAQITLARALTELEINRISSSFKA
ncbi:hypothetical protein GVAMD_1242 [Gardnerella vaginalis AMD]|nr:hypothetical protein GVAMD_1242 [Gardnerella vaginalis AMD]